MIVHGRRVGKRRRLDDGWRSHTSMSQAPAAASIADRLDRLPPSRWHRRMVTLLGLGSFFNFFELALGGFFAVLLATEWPLTLLDRSLIIGSVFAGETVGSLLLAPLADRLGRRVLFQANLLLYGGLSMATALAPNLAVFLIMRVFTGVGLGAELILVDTYLAELLPANHRGRYMAWSYTLGLIAAPVVGGLARAANGTFFGVAGWRWLLVMVAFGGLVVWVARRRLPESPRWLAANGHLAQADRIVTAIECTVHDKSAASDPPLALDPANHAAPTRPLSSRYRPRKLLLWLIWVLQPIGFYGFASIAPVVLLAKGFDLSQSLTYSALHSVGFPLGSLISVYLTDRVQRRDLLIAATLAAALFIVSFGFAAAPALIIAFGIATTVSLVVQSNIIHTYHAELFQTANRSTAIGLPYAASRVVSALVPLVALALLPVIGPAGIYACCAALMATMAAVIQKLGPRTNKRQLDTF
jgi:putative MFS transporter